MRDPKSKRVFFIFLKTRKIPAGELKLELFLEGDLANITLIQHQIKDKLKGVILDKKVERIPYQNYVGVTLIR